MSVDAAPRPESAVQHEKEFLSSPVLSAWRSAFPEPGAPGGPPAIAGHTVCGLEQWRQLSRETEPYELARTVLAVTLAVNAGTPQIALTTTGADSGASGLRTLQIDPDATLTGLAGSWCERTAGGELQQRIEAALLPHLQWTGNEEETGTAPGTAGNQTDEAPSVGPLSCEITTTADGIGWTLRARPDIASRAALRALLEQIRSTFETLTIRPGTTVRELAGRLHSLDRTIAVFGEPDFSAGRSALHAWGQAVGIGVTAIRVEPEQIHGRTNTPDSSWPRPQQRRANLLVLAPDSCPAAQPAPHPELTAILPDGRPIAALNTNETHELFDEIVVRRRYLRHGLDIADGDLVVDAGANIGIFALFAAASAAGVQVAAFEPAPAVADRLHANLDAYGINATVHRAALGAAAGTRTLTFYPHSTLQSGFHTDAGADRAVVRRYAGAQARRRAGHDRQLADELSHLLEPAIAGTTDAPQQIQAPVVRLSDVICDAKITTIGLLKIDVERAEEDVLAGIDEQHWPMIRQVVAEVHDIGGRLARITALLQQRGLHTVVEQDEMFDGTEIFMVYARRPGTSPRPRWLTDGLETAERWRRNSPDPLYVTASIRSRLQGAAHLELLRRESSTAGLHWIEPATAEASTEPPLAWAEGVLREMTATQRSVLKALVVDADNLLWAGVCGEIGPQNVTVTGPYLQIQHLLLEQRRLGRHLCLCSRNNLDDVHATFAAHPEMPLRLDDFAVVQVGWGRKSQAVTQIADTLGFAPAALAFLDDSPAERAEVALAHPQVTVVDLPDDPDGFPAAIRATWQLQPAAGLTDEDRGRARMLAEETRRQAAAAQLSTTADFLEYLGLQVTVEHAAEADAERISQLTARTTQFNMALRPRPPAAIRSMIASGASLLTVRVSDRFGDYGLVGVLSAEPSGSTLHVQDMLLSCRALGRNVEWAMLRALGELASSQGLTTITIDTTPGPRNVPARDFLTAALDRYPAPGITGGLVDAAAAATLPWRQIDFRRDPQTAAAVTTATIATSEDTEATPPAAAAPNRPKLPVADQPIWPVSTAAAQDAARTLRRPGTPVSAMFSPPQGTQEKDTAHLWENVLGIAPIGRHDDLFVLGCDSVTIALICASMRQGGIAASFADLIEHPTVARLTDHLTRTPPEQPTPPSPVPQPGSATAEPPRPGQPDRPPAEGPVGPRDDALLASGGQQRIWAAEAIGGRGNAQIIPLVHRITGPLDIPRLRDALNFTIERRDALRSVLIEHDSQLILQINPATPIDLPVIDLTDPATDRAQAIDAAARQFYARPFALDRDPMLRSTLLRLGPRDYLLLTAVHHSAADGFSTDLILQDISAAYTGGPAPATLPLAGAFASYARRAAAVRQDDELRQRADRRRAALPRFSAPWSGSSGMPVAARHVRTPLSAALTAAAAHTARTHATTPLSVYLAAHQLLLAALGGARDIITGCPVAAREDQDLTGTVGFIANLVPVAAHIDDTDSLGDYLDTTADQVAAALRDADIPYAILSAGHSPSPAGFDTLFTLQPEPAHPLTVTGCAVSSSEPAIWPLPYSLMVDVQQGPAEASLLVRFDAHAIHPVPPDQLTTAYPLTLAALCTLPGMRIGQFRQLLNPHRDAAGLIRDRLHRATATPDGSRSLP
ncbi:FkbH-like protein/FkbM family methyltransferase [Catenuloplanes nepalensis]|uniref:FkbH-like protein/FkbM family methyltransferase n=1 Tax=Catenuloplanes nepalensis TaxID=587533 RepID=A0ABT9MM63_9ACTN|nr:FkbM family methyltransferase [Catenuloplanes nepalensis]MDP9792490.1 FkbH-like protein/FkbM family methyltransferase [Catenuloplanes nepalensis]